MKILKLIYNKAIRPAQIKHRVNIINDLNIDSILDVGAMDENYKDKINYRIKYFGIDIEPKSENIIKGDFMKFNFKNKFDLVCAFTVLEHLENPVEAIKKLKSLSNKYILIAVPHEPYYTISRFFIPEKEHYWTIHPNILEHYLGKPIFQKKIHLGREYLALYEI